jgi:hypothetical protein
MNSFSFSSPPPAEVHFFSVSNPSRNQSLATLVLLNKWQWVNSVVLSTGRDKYQMFDPCRSVKGFFNTSKRKFPISHFQLKIAHVNRNLSIWTQRFWKPKFDLKSRVTFVKYFNSFWQGFSPKITGNWEDFDSWFETSLKLNNYLYLFNPKLVSVPGSRIVVPIFDNAGILT